MTQEHIPLAKMEKILRLADGDLTDKLADSNYEADDLSFLPSFYNDTAQCDLKLQVIKRALEKKDIALLCTLGRTKRGFVNNEVRQRSWSTILNSQLLLPSGTTTTGCTKHCDEKQIVLDIKRSFGYIESATQRETLQNTLQDTIVAFFRKYPSMRYYQGYHDIVSVFVLVFCKYSTRKTTVNKISGVRKKTLNRCVEVFSLVYLRDFLMDSLDFPIDQTLIIPLLIKDKNPDLFKRLQLDKQKPLFAIASLLTIFSHDIKPDISIQNSLIFQIFDMVIGTHSMYTPLILYSNIVLDLRDKLNQEYSDNIDNFDNEVDLVHAVVQKVLTKTLCDEKQSSKLWDTALAQTRANFSLDPRLEKKVCTFINKASPLRTTANGKPQLEINDINSVNKLINKGIALNNKKKDKVPKDNNDKDWNYDKLIKTSLLVGAASLTLGACHQNGYLLPGTMSSSHIDLGKIVSSVSLVTDSLKHIINSA